MRYDSLAAVAVRGARHSDSLALAAGRERAARLAAEAKVEPAEAVTDSVLLADSVSAAVEQAITAERADWQAALATSDSAAAEWQAAYAAADSVSTDLRSELAAVQLSLTTERALASRCIERIKISAARCSILTFPTSH